MRPRPILLRTSSPQQNGKYRETSRMASCLVLLKVLAVVTVCCFGSVVPILLQRNDCLCDPVNAFLDSLPLNRERTNQLLGIDGYQGRAYQVVTKDGYILRVYRIWRDQASSGNSTRGVILLQHGIMHSSADWLVLGPGRSLAYQLVDHGYDVWLGNSRSSLNSHQHVKLCSCSKEFWDYSWHEMGFYDLPAMIDTVLARTQQPKLRLVVYSEGGGLAMVMLSTRPEYNNKLVALDALAPAAFVSNTWYRFLALPLAKIPKVFRSAYALYPTNEVTVKACETEKDICTDLYYQFLNGESVGMNRTWIDRIYQSLPAGASIKEVLHYIQLIWTKKFAPFDHGVSRNLQVYGSRSPPEYPLDRVSIPVNIHYGLRDKIVDPVGVMRLGSRLINSPRVRLRPYNELQHSDFIYGDAAYEIVYKDVLMWIEEPIK